MRHESIYGPRVFTGACRQAGATALGLVLALGAHPALAQGQEAEAEPRASTLVEHNPADQQNDIVVTARKREETSLSVPVIMTAMSGEQLGALGINTIDGLGRLAPNLLAGESAGAQQGLVLIRGISGAEGNPTADQAVSFNIDGVQVSRATVRRMAFMDIARVEVLKGPQALFFGKNSPGGVISLAGAEPTDVVEAKLSAGFEPLATEFSGEGFFSAPITPELGARIAFYASDIGGWGKNLIPSTDTFAPADRDVGESKEYAVRGTIKYEPASNLTAVFRASYSSLRTNGLFNNSQYVYCPNGSPQLGDPIPCKADRFTYYGGPGPFVQAVNPRIRGDSTFFRQTQGLYSLNLRWNVTDNIDLYSVTGFYDIKSNGNDNTATTANPAFIRPLLVELDFREISQEFRIQSGFDSFFNFAIGTHLSDSKAHSLTQTYAGAVALTPGAAWDLIQRGRAYSVFGQAILTPMKGLELSAGGRYSYERKKLPQVRAGSPLRDNVLAVTRETWTDFSPEATISYRPSDHLTVFGTYKEGFLSGGFDAARTRLPNADARYDQQTISGFEGGVKALLFDSKLRLDLAAYSYNLKGLQVSTVINSVVMTSNAGRVSTDGIEFSANYRTPVDGLTINAAVGYLDAVFDEYIESCYPGQTQAMGCNFGPLGANGRYSLQDRSGQQLTRAPKWTINGGFSYKIDLSSGEEIGLTTNVAYVGKYNANFTGAPASTNESYALVDAAIDFTDKERKWNFAILGKNLTDRYYFLRAGFSTGTGSPAGGLTGSLADTEGAVMSRGRQVMFRITRYFGEGRH